MPSVVKFPCRSRSSVIAGTLYARCNPSSARPRRVAVLGSTGSIGTSALDVIRHLPDRLELVGLAAHSKWEQLAEQCREFRPRVAVLTDPGRLQARRPQSIPPRNRTARRRRTASRSSVADPEVDVVLSAVVGAAGLRGTWAALEAGKTRRAGEQGNARRRRAAGHGPGREARREAPAGR